MQCESGFYGKVEVLDRFFLPEDFFYTPQKGTRQKKKKKRKKEKDEGTPVFWQCYYYFY